jgi:alpha-1,2-mannosyltransferase
LLAALRDGTFLQRRWLIAIPALLVFGFTLAIAWLFLSAHGANDWMGRPLGTDFSNVYAAGVAANQGHAAQAFDIARQYKQEQALFGESTPLYGWHYPPFFLLVAAPLAHLPYLDALIAWQLVTLTLYLWAMQALIRRSGVRVDTGQWLLVASGFTAVFVNLTHGHNGFLTAALFAGALALLDERPWMAGLLFGLLAYKPQFGVMIPLGLLAGGYFRTVAAAALTVALLGLLTTLLFGWDVWPAFLASTHFTRTIVLEQGGTGFEKIQTIFAQVRLLGGPVALAYLAQAAFFLVSAFLVVRLWRRSASFEARGAALCLAAILATPYALDYDLMLLAPALMLLAAQGTAKGFRPYELTLLTALWLLPVMARNLAAATHILLAPFMILALLVMTQRRV